MIDFALPWVGLLFPLPLLVWFLVPPARESLAAVRVPFFWALAEATGTTPKTGSVVLRRRALQLIPAFIVWSLLLLALAQPRWVGPPIEETDAARDVMLAIDVSGSMDERDFPSESDDMIQRLEAVKGVLRRFVRERPDDRVGLIVFGSQSFVQAPFTRDLDTLEALIESVDVGMAGPHTVIGDAIGLAIQTFEASELPQRFLILLTDGADTNSRMTPINAAAIAARNEIEIYTIGVGDPEARRSEQVDFVTLQRVAEKTGGRFFEAKDEVGLASVYERIDQLVPRETQVRSYRPRRSLVHWPAGALSLLIVASYAVLLVWNRPERESPDETHAERDLAEVAPQ